MDNNQEGIPEVDKLGRTKEETAESDDIEKILEAILWDRGKIELCTFAGSEAKEQLKELIITPDKNLPSGDSNRDLGPILVYGAPGCGKTILVRSAGSQLQKSKFIHVSCSDLISKWLNKGHRLTAEVFKFAKKNKPSVLFIDDLDLIGIKHLSPERLAEIKQDLLYHIDDCMNFDVLVIAASSSPWQLDPEIKHRFVKYIYLPLPKLETREEIIKINLVNTKHNLSGDDVKLLGARTEGFTGADISVMVRDGLMGPIRRIQNATHFCKKSAPSPDNPDVILDDFYIPCLPDAKNAIKMTYMEVPEDKFLDPVVTMDDFLEAVNNTQPSVSEEEIKKFLQFME